MAQRGSNSPSQALLNPVTVELPAGSARLLAEQLPLLAELGFQVEPFGPNTFLVRAVPSLLTTVTRRRRCARWLRISKRMKLLYNPNRRRASSPASANARRSRPARRFRLTNNARLLLDLERCQSPRTCPHGRPTMIHLSVDLLERQFGRRGPR